MEGDDFALAWFNAGCEYHRYVCARVRVSDTLRAFLSAFDALPLGYFTADYKGARYGVTKTQNRDGRQANLVARELGGTDYISLNLYRLASGARLKPCEMPAQKVIDFVTGATVVP